jgi:protein gp37
VNQDEFDRDWPKLRAVPAKVRGLSVEPMLGPIDLSDDVRGALHWIIYGGESKQGGAEARPCDVMWIVDGIVQCREFGIAPFVKQLGHGAHGSGAPLTFKITGKGADPAEWPNGLRVQEFPL